MLAALAFLSVIQAPPADLEKIAARLRETGADVRVSNVENPAWEIWYDFTGRFTDETAKPLHGIKKLSAIRIFSDDLTDKHLRQIKDLPDLNLLVVMSSKLTDDATIPISRLSGLVKLDINKARLTRKGLSRLASLKKLKRLYLYNAKIEDAEMEPLKKLRHLRVLDLPNSVSPATLAALRKALPDTVLVLSGARGD